MSARFAPRDAASCAVPILMYHNVSEPPAEIRTHRALYVTPRRFAAQMWLLKQLGYRGLSMSQAMPYLRGERTGRVAAITFDDGYRDNLVNALPELQRHGFTATCYVVSGHVGQHNEWDAKRLGVRKPIMAAGELRRWCGAGMEVGAHTRSHPQLTQCDAHTLRDEIAGSRHALEDAIGAGVPQFCYPYGDHDDAVVDAVREAGFAAAVTTQRGRARAGQDPFRLPRVAVCYRHLLPSFAWRVATGYEDRRNKALASP